MRPKLARHLKTTNQKLHRSIKSFINVLQKMKQKMLDIVNIALYLNGQKKLNTLG